MVVPELSTRTTASALTVASAAAVAVAGAAVAASLPWYTTYASVSPYVLVADAAAALALLGAGLALSLERGDDIRSTLLVLSSAAWACADWVGWQGGPDVVRTLGVVGHAALLPLVAHLVVRTWPAWHALRRAVPWMYGVTLAVAVARLAVTDPMVDSACWQNCTANTLLVIAQPTFALVLSRISLIISVLTGVAVAAAACGLAVVGGHAARRRHLPLLVPAAVVGAVYAVGGALVLGGTAETPLEQPFVVLHLVLAGALLGLAGGVTLVVARSRRARRRTKELARNLGQAKDRSVASLLGGATGDSTVEVAYRVREPDGWVDMAGRRVPGPDAHSAPGVVPVTRNGDLVAVIKHDPEVAADIDLASALGPAARLAIENESLQAQQRTRLHELRDSQRRIVDAADAERARLERNLHDAAQVSVLGVIDTVQRALRAALDDGNAAASQLLSGAVEEARATMDELRELARGIHPAILDLEGLAPALETLADHAQIRVEVAVREHERPPSAVEHAVYYAAAEAIREAARRGEDDLLIQVHLTGGWVEVVVDGTCQPPTDAMRDRVGALGGVVTSNPVALKVRMPCVS